MRMYLYLARRDRKGARVVMVLDGEKTWPARVTDLKAIQLPDNIYASVEHIIHENRMYWEPWIESADSYEELKKSLIRRGYMDLYVSSKPLYDGSSLLYPPSADISSLPKQRTMITKGKTF